ncbi:SDR family NAD(P)-dependent oxidoreductase [Mycolicibacterium pyrenivorans]|uniref:SDR family NAD(P)-dependent oxidoreductase n=1 Tax=Mycolicibacterium pyrenivorans TaxID=187102 RepID=UPI003557A2CD
MVVVTGAGRGVGRSHALSFAARGARVVVADLGVQVDGSAPSSDPAHEVVGEISANGGEAIARYCSVADEDSAAAIVAAAVDTYGRIDAVVNNAGIGLGGLFADTDPQQFRTLMDVHYFGTLYVTRAAWPHFVSRPTVCWSAGWPTPSIRCSAHRSAAAGRRPPSRRVR